MEGQGAMAHRNPGHFLRFALQRRRGATTGVARTLVPRTVGRQRKRKVLESRHKICVRDRSCHRQACKHKGF